MKEKKAIEYNAGLGSNQNLAGTPSATTGTLNRSKETLMDDSNSPTKGSNPNISRSVLNLASANPNILLTADGSVMTFSQLKIKALENMAALESEGLVKKSNHYQDMLNLIAKDMLNKHRRRSQRARELETLRNTLANLKEKAVYLTEQKKSYVDYVDSCIKQIGNKNSGKGKKQPLLFTKQYYHIRELQKTGKVPKFGSFKWTADSLLKRGVLLSIDDYSPKQFKQITLSISSDEAGVFLVEAAFMGIKLPEKMELRLDDLLQSQYNGVQTITLFDMAKVNVNLLIYMINKKFFV